VKQDIPVSIPGGEQVRGSHPLVVIAPNGSGKTGFALVVANLDYASDTSQDCKEGQCN